MKILFIEPSFGVSGDMLLAGFIDLGLDKIILEKELSKLINQKISIEVKNEQTNGITGKKIKIFFEERGFRDLKNITDLISNSHLSEFVKNKTLLAFDNLAEVESRIHNIPKENVHFHELSGIDTIIDICGFFIAIEYLDIKKIYVSPVPLGKGYFKSSHSIMPNPAFATLELLKGFSVYGIDIDKENVTPTSAVLLKVSGESSLFPSFKLDKIGYGVGNYRFDSFPNMVRLSLGIVDDEILNDEVVSISFNVDDISSEILGYFAEKVMAEGALDMSFTPIFMKKGRPAYKVNLLVYTFDLNKFLDIIFTETTTLGVRYSRVKRFLLKREIKKIKTNLGTIRFKESRYKDKVRLKPEYEDLKDIAIRNRLPLKEVMALIQRDIHNEK